MVGRKGLYEVSDLGRIKYLARFSGDGHWREERISSGFRIKKGYMAYGIGKCQILVHIAVMRAFKGSCPDGLEVCHDDGDGCNNALTNLRYDTHANNNRDRIRHGTIPRGEGVWKSILTEEAVLAISASTARGSDLAAEHGVSPAAICDIRKGRSWAWLTGR